MSKEPNENEFRLTFSYKTFEGRIGVGSVTVEADSLETAQENAFKIFYEDLVEEKREFICNLSISVEPK